MSILFPAAGNAINIRLLSVGYIELGPWWAQTDLLRGFWRLYLNRRDGAGLKLASGHFPMPRNRIVLVPPAVDFEARLERSLEQLFVHFECVGWSVEAARRMFPAPLVLPRGEQRDSLARGLCEELAASAETLEPVLAGRVKALVHLAISDAVETARSRGGGEGPRMSERHRELGVVFQHIDAHLAERISVPALAQLARASESHFIRSFREVTGHTPGRYIQEKRVQRSAQLLISTSDSIEEIAERCGFANRYYFSRVFAQRMGCPPARYRSDRRFVEAGAS